MECSPRSYKSGKVTDVSTITRLRIAQLGEELKSASTVRKKDIIKEQKKLRKTLRMNSVFNQGGTRSYTTAWVIGVTALLVVSVLVMSP